MPCAAQLRQGAFCAVECEPATMEDPAILVLGRQDGLHHGLLHFGPPGTALLAWGWAADGGNINAVIRLPSGATGRARVLAFPFAGRQHTAFLPLPPELSPADDFVVPHGADIIFSFEHLRSSCTVYCCDFKGAVLNIWRQVCVCVCVCVWLALFALGSQALAVRTRVLCCSPMLHCSGKRALG